MVGIGSARGHVLEEAFVKTRAASCAPIAIVDGGGVSLPKSCQPGPLRLDLAMLFCKRRTAKRVVTAWQQTDRTPWLSKEQGLDRWSVKERS